VEADSKDNDKKKTGGVVLPRSRAAEQHRPTK
jgi:hypothetical protein